MKLLHPLAHLALYSFAIAFAIACTILALLGAGGCKKVSDPVVADSVIVRSARLGGATPARAILVAPLEPHLSPTKDGR